MAASLGAWANNNHYYSKLTATATPTGAGLVYVSASNEAPAADAYQETSEAMKDDTNSSLTYYLFAKPSAGQKLEGWYTDADCSEAAETTKDGNVYAYTVRAASTTAGAPSEFSIYAKFVEALDAYSSTLNVTVVGADGCTVSINGGEPSASATASLLETVDPEQRYTLSVSDALPLDCRFVGWYSDEACTKFISRAKTLNHDVVALSTDAADPTVFSLYAKFETFNVYQLRNASFEDWESVSAGSINGEEPTSWNSFITATGSMVGMVRAVQLAKDDTDAVDGQYSARLNARSVAGLAMAQGNMTTGCINGGSMTATDANGNYNYTNEAGDEQAMYFAGRPDAMKVWVKSSCSGTVKIAAFLHEKGYFQDPVTGNVNKQVPLVASGEIAPESNDLVWTEYEVPFTYASENNPYYALVSFATSSVPGQGSASDYMLIDNVKMVYNSELAASTYDGQELNFVDGTATVAADFDETLLQLVSTGVAATIETAYDAEARTLSITVKGQDIAYDTENVHHYTIQFVDAESGGDEPEPEAVAYTDRLVVVVDGTSTDPQQATVYFSVNDDSTCNFSLPNFCLGSGDSAAPVGNIAIQDIPLSTNESGISTFAFTGNINITAGDDPSRDFWIGPGLGELPLSLSGKVREDKMYVTIDLDLEEQMGQIVYVQFGDANFNAVTYTDELVVVVDEVETDPQTTSVIFNDNGDGTCNFSLPNFCLGSGDSAAPVGNIDIQNIPLTDEGEGVRSFAYTGNILITAGDDPTKDYWMGPGLGELPLSLTGKVTDDKIYVAIDLNLEELLCQIVFVTFGDKSLAPSAGISGITVSGATAVYDLAGRSVAKSAMKAGKPTIVISAGRKMIAQ